MRFFIPRAAQPYVPPVPQPEHHGYTNQARFVDYAKTKEKIEPEKQLTRQERKKRDWIQKQEMNAAKIALLQEEWNPLQRDQSKVTSTPSKTLFVGRIDYTIDDEALLTEFSAYGEVSDAKIVRDLNGKSCGYGFVEFVHNEDFQRAYHDADGLKLGNRKIVVDVERGRTQPNWLPRYLGGGLGKTRVGNDRKNSKEPGRVNKHHEQRVPSASLHSRYDRERAQRNRRG